MQKWLAYIIIELDNLKFLQTFPLFWMKWKRISHKQSARWQHLSQLKASALFFFQKIVSCMKCNNLYLGLVMPSSGWWSPIRHVQSSTFGFSACLKITFFYFLSVFHKTQILNSNQWNFSLVELHHHNVLIKNLGLSPPLILRIKMSMFNPIKTTLPIYIGTVYYKTGGTCPSLLVVANLDDVTHYLIYKVESGCVCLCVCVFVCPV
jgi:hypothetical protein